LLAAVGEGRAGIVMARDLSRLARAASDWSRLVEVCSLTDTVILEDRGVYDPCARDDRLLLGVDPIMSAIEVCTD
jgi:DNA invertase Pin-like site-specific DNA recombinase